MTDSNGVDWNHRITILKIESVRICIMCIDGGRCRFIRVCELQQKQILKRIAFLSGPRSKSSGN